MKDILFFLVYLLAVAIVLLIMNPETLKNIPFRFRVWRIERRLRRIGRLSK
jgi:hypothetical protein